MVNRFNWISNYGKVMAIAITEGYMNGFNSSSRKVEDNQIIGEQILSSRDGASS
jgi:hypothetical protein